MPFKESDDFNKKLLTEITHEAAVEISKECKSKVEVQEIISGNNIIESASYAGKGGFSVYGEYSTCMSIKYQFKYFIEYFSRDKGKSEFIAFN